VGDLVFVDAGSAVEVAEAAGDAAVDVAGMGYRSRWLRAGGASGATDVSVAIWICFATFCGSRPGKE
jgi:hypothetical protein